MGTENKITASQSASRNNLETPDNNLPQLNVPTEL